MLVKEAEAIAGTLSNTSKMPGYSTSIPAKYCRVGSKLRGVPGSVCESCYGCKGNYTFYPEVQRSLDRRYAGLRHPLWVEAMVTLIVARTDPANPYFRWHDVGDLQDIGHLWRICQVAKRTPEVHHWLPTRERAIVGLYRRTLPQNLTIRIPAPMIDGDAPRVSAPLVSSTVHKSKAPIGHRCPSPDQAGKCGDCRACWNRKVGNVSYKKH
jgi:hypothetical protein